jgi:hypothetical protein
MEQSKKARDNRYVEFWVLLRHLDAMCNGIEQWRALPLAPSFISTKGDVLRYVLVGYSNPDPSHLPNTLVYLVPIERYRPCEDAPESLYCSVGFDMIVPLAKGLYWAKDVLNYDLVEDLVRFCEPLMRQLSLPVPPKEFRYPNSPARQNSDADSQTMDGMSYRESLLAKLRWWSGRRQKIQNAVWLWEHPDSSNVP